MASQSPMASLLGSSFSALMALLDLLGNRGFKLSLQVRLEIGYAPNPQQRQWMRFKVVLNPNAARGGTRIATEIVRTEIRQPSRTVTR